MKHTKDNDFDGAAHVLLVTRKRGRVMRKKMYIVLTDTGTLLSKAIGMYTREDLNHVSIAFDEQLTEMYSFGRKHRHNPFTGGFVKEDATEGMFEYANCAIYSCDVTDEAYDKMRSRIREFEQTKELYKYNFIGLFAVAVNRDFERKHAYFCSQFVATIINECGIQMFTVPPNLVQPHHFAKVTYLQPVFHGNLQGYLQNVRGSVYSTQTKLNLWQHVRSRMFA